MAKYDDTRTLGKSQIVPFKRDEDWHSRHARRMNANLNHADELKNWCGEHGWRFDIKNEGHHWMITKGKTIVEWWPSSAKLVKNKQWGRGYHCHDYLKVIEFLEKQ